MKTFLEQLAGEVMAKHGSELASLCMVFPTRRAGLYFKKTLASENKSPIWSPAVFSIEDFTDSLSPYRTGNQLDLVFSLFECYRKYFPDEPFHRFYPWGVMLLKDFEDVDSSLADGKKIFTTISTMKELDEAWQTGEENEGIRNFWKLFFDREPGPVRKSFMDNWKHIQRIYEEFRALLVSGKSVYPGLSLRAVSEGLRDGSIVSPYRHHVFAGFYALSRAEEAVIRFFLENKTGSVYFDSDTYYADDARQEAGLYIRKNKLADKIFSWKEDLLGSDSKNIEVIGVPLQVLQAKVAGQILVDKGLDTTAAGKTAVVLPDERLLLPVLYSLPAQIEDINVTMGYPLRQSPLYDLVESVFALQKSILRDSYYFKNIVSILSHPYLQILKSDEVNSWLTAFRKSPRIRIQETELLNYSPLFRILFKGFSSTAGAIEYFNHFFILLIDVIRNNRDAMHAMEKEYVYYFYTRFKKLEEIVAKQSGEITVETFRQLFKEVIYATRIPFTGEPLKGLQVMGFLETRVLDFENVIILSLNEDVLPPSGHHPSFIPYNIRKAFGLPTFDDHHAIAAYHFYRLLQRAKNIFLVYNTEVKNFSGGEKSRFLLQIENELLSKNKNISFTERYVPVGVTQPDIPPVIVPKTGDVMKELSGFFEPLREPVKYAKKFSASALSTYIACPLRFYFQYVAKLREPDEMEEYIEGGLLGTILHEAMQQLYGPMKTITPGDFERILPLAERAVDEAIKSNFASADQIEGKNLLLRNVLIELVKRIIRFDKETAPLEIMFVEEAFTMPLEIESGKHVHLYGIIDRVDQVMGGLRIVDYKTGIPDEKNAPDIPSLFSSPDYKEQFQTFFYSMLLQSRVKSMPIKAGLFRLKESSKGISYINKSNPISENQFAEFFNHTRNLVGEIFNPEVPFTQTDDETRCKYCAFKDICNR